VPRWSGYSATSPTHIHTWTTSLWGRIGRYGRGADFEPHEGRAEGSLKPRRQQLVSSPAKSAFFQREVEFLGHVICEVVRKPSSGKLLPLQKWEISRTITELRLGLGLTNYFSQFVTDYSNFAAPLMAKLKVGREDGKKCSQKAALEPSRN